MNKAIKGIREFYNAAAEKWADKWYADETLLPLLHQFIALMGEKPRILDIGCGAGYESMRLHNLGAELVGIDISEESIRIARKHNPDCCFELMDCREIDDALGLFDGILSLALIVHFKDDELIDIFKKHKKMLKDSGYMFIAYVEGEGFCEERSYYEINGEQYNREFYLHETNVVMESAEKAGFKYHDELHLDEPFGRWQFFVFRA